MNGIMDLTRRYNNIKYVHEQRDWLTTADFQDAILGLAEIFIRHGANVNFAIALLHRHHRLRPGYALIHDRDSSGADICSMEQLGTRRIYPYAYHCCFEPDTPFLPFEFSFDPLPIPGTEFLSDVAAYLRLRNLWDKIAISHSDGSQQMRIEKLSDDGHGTTAVVASEGQALLDANYIVTEWSVAQDENGIKILAVKGCDDQEVGHARK